VKLNGKYGNKKDRNMKYRTEIDELIAVAILSVVLFHAGFSFFKGGDTKSKASQNYFIKQYDI
jgi:peptidoglycan/LPS O-acetylase OafA/YrhL